MVFESEVTFAITAKNLDIARDIAGISSIRGYRLKPQPRLRITDTYYDTKHRHLGTKKIGLRTRKSGGRLLISMKSNPQRISGGGLRRIEFECPWSYESLAEVARVLKLRDLPPKVQFAPFQPSKVLARMGLERIQERRTTRDVRDIIPRSGSGNRRIAELDIDRVTFLGKPKVRFFEVEIEAKAPKAVKSVQEAAAELQSSYSGFLLVWPHGKLVTGLAIERLWENEKLSNHVEGGWLKPTAFSMIDKEIRTGKLKAPEP